MSSWPVCALVVVWSALLSLLGGGSTVTGGPLLRTFLAAHPDLTRVAEREAERGLSAAASS